MTISTFSSARTQLLLVTCHLDNPILKQSKIQLTMYILYSIFPQNHPLFMQPINHVDLHTFTHAYSSTCQLSKTISIFGSITHQMPLYTVMSLTHFSFNLWNHLLSSVTPNLISCIFSGPSFFVYVQFTALCYQSNAAKDNVIVCGLIDVLIKQKILA